MRGYRARPGARPAGGCPGRSCSTFIRPGTLPMVSSRSMFCGPKRPMLRGEYCSTPDETIRRVCVMDVGSRRGGGTTRAQPSRGSKRKLVEAWIEIHRDELVADWGLAVDGEPSCRRWVSGLSMRGRSPRMRGSPVRYRPRRAPGGDPRACGGAPRSRGAATDSRGRSPRMRGSHVEHGLQRECRGAIPAHAGEPDTPSLSDGQTTGDPRACGGAVKASPEEIKTAGRSPRMRGSLAPKASAM